MAGGYFPDTYFAFDPGTYFPRAVSNPTPPVNLANGGGGDRRRKEEMSVEQFHLMNRQIREDDQTVLTVIEKFLKGIHQ